MNRYEGFVGKVLDGRYKILELVGMGGMACVLKAQDLVMNRIVAIKILNDEYNGNQQAEARFIDESKAVAMLSNKNIVNVFDVAIYPDIKYIVMEYLDGITLREYLDNKGAISWKEACIYILQILRALEHAHSKGIIHRDIKPQNVMLMKNGDIKVTDFGIAKLPNSVSDNKDEKAIGTVYYISPEQACGKETDYYSDLYSVGIMFYEAVTGTLPFTAETPMEVAMMQVNDDPVHPRDIVLDVPVGVSQIILKAMEKSPSDRFQSAHTMSKAIEWVLRNPDVIFAMNPNAAEEGAGKSSIVSIDMISTAEIEPYGDEEIADSLGKKPGKSRSKGVSGSINSNDAKSKSSQKKKKKKRKVSRSMFPIIAGVAIPFFIVTLILAIMLVTPVLESIFSQADDSVEITYPDLTGKLYNDTLANELRNGKYGAKFIVDEIIYDSRDDIENNKIIATEPAGGHISKTSSGGQLHFDSITVNRSKKVIMPNVMGMPKTSVTTLLKNLELSYVFEEVTENENPYFHNNQIIGTFPPEGSEVKVGDTITVYVCSKTSSANTAKLPDLFGMTEADAIKFAKTYSGYEVAVEYLEVLDGNNTVLSQDIDAGTISPKGTIVTICIGIPPTGMPDFTGLTPEEAQAMLIAAAPDKQISVYNRYFTANAANKEYIEAAREQYGDNMIMFIDTLLRLGCTEAAVYDGSSTVFYQSIPADAPITADIYGIDLIIIQYTDVTGPEISLDPTDQSGTVDENNTEGGFWG
ncbi:MAG: Stk1 family PASTA domain-containing Ser/Thr kinase [Clostridia bacterium]|nr:Stk1 family PASTA domain-containing Ser/Thr kinase [Clostridia bacterium]